MDESVQNALKFYLRDYLEKELFRCRSTLMDYRPKRRDKRTLPAALLVMEKRMYKIEALLEELE